MPTQSGTGGPPHTLTGLTAGTEYDVRVREANAAGTSQWSPWSRFATLATELPPSGGGTARADYYGMAEPWGTVAALTTPQLTTYMSNIAATGATWWRTDIRIFELENTQGQRNWSQVDLVINAAKAAGLKVLLVPTGVPAWARAGTPSTWQRGAVTTAEQDAVAAYFAAAVQRYPQVDAWEMWNEPNYSQFWQPAPTDGVPYTQLMKKIYAASKPFAPAGVPLLAGGTAIVGLRANAFWQSVYNNGGGPFLDGIAMHPYPNVGWTRGGQMFTGNEMEDVAAVRTTMNAAGDNAKRIWATEIGFPTFSGWSPPLTEAEQATWTPQLWEAWFDQSTARGATGPAFHYQWKDQDTADTVDAEAHFGIVRSDGTIKPAYTTMKNWATQ